MTATAPRDHALLPIRHPQRDLFICDIADCVLKNDIASMEHPIFSLSTRPDLTVREYHHGNVRLTVTPSVKGMATIHDKDILIFAISQLMAANNKGQDISREIRLSARSFLIFANRHTGGKDYDQLEAALDRLTGTRLKTTIATGGERQETWFGLVEQAYVRRQILNDGSQGRITELRITLSEWLFNAIQANEVLTMHPDYFRLRKPMERRIYEIARKHCGKQRRWSIGIDALYRKSGSRGPKKQFQYLLKRIAKTSILPGYHVGLSDASDTIEFSALNR